MSITTLKDFHERLHYLLTDGTLSELIEFLGMQYFDGSRKGYNETRDVYEFVEGGTMAIEVLLAESRVRFWSNFSSWMSVPKNDAFWYLLFDEYPKLVKRLLDLLDKEYSYLGSLSYEVRLDGKFVGFTLKDSVLNDIPKEGVSSNERIHL